MTIDMKNPVTHVTLLGPSQDLDTEHGGQARLEEDMNIIKAQDILLEEQKPTIMSVTHTPLLGPSHVYGGQARQTTVTSDKLQRAGISNRCREWNSRTDMRKPVSVQGSPNIFPMDKSPVMVGGRLERFGEISSMIAHWEGQEERLNNDEGGGGRQKSKVIKELSLAFEGGEKPTHRDRPKSWGGREGGREIFHSTQISPTEYFGSNYLNGAGEKTPSPSTAVSKLSKIKLLFSPTNENSLGNVLSNRSPDSTIDTRTGGNIVVQTNPRWRGVKPGQS